MLRTAKPDGTREKKSRTTRQCPLTTPSATQEKADSGSTPESLAYGQFLDLTTDGVWRYDVVPSVSTKLPEREQAEAILGRAHMGFCNRAFARLYGFESPDELIGIPLGRLLAGTDEDKIRFVAASIRTGYRFADVEVMTQNREGQTVWTLNNIAGIVKRGRLVCGWGTSRDITDLKAAEEARQEAHAELRATLAASPDLVFEVDAEGRIYEYRAPDPDQLYAPPASLLGRTIAEVLPPDPVRRILGALRDAVQHGSHRGTTYSLDLPDGRRWFDLSVAMKGNERGPLAHYIAIARDVTLREAAAAAMRASEERLALALDATSDGLYDIDFETRTTHYSPRYATMLGYEPNELTPSHETWERLLHPGDRTRALESLNECLDGKRDEYEMEFRLRTKSGAWRWILSRGKIVARDASGRALRLVGTHRDITARVESVAALAESERRYREMANALPTCVFEADLNGRLTYANQTGLDWFGYSEGEIVRQRSVAEMVIEEQRERAARTFRRAAEVGEVPAGEYTALRSDGKTFPALVSSRAIVRDGKPIGVRGVLVDITERVEAARRIERALSGTIHALAVTTEMRDPYTAGHQERVTRLAMAMAARMGLPADRVEGLRVAGLLHDVGKVSVPAEILSKPTGLSAIELALVRSHSEAGYAIVREIAFPWPVATIVLQHHERMDGSGYPSGLRGEEILLEARILAVADSVEAMASHRPYRAALGIEEALAELARGRGTAYDVDAASACLSLFTEDGFRWDV